MVLTRTRMVLESSTPVGSVSLIRSSVLLEIQSLMVIRACSGFIYRTTVTIEMTLFHVYFSRNKGQFMFPHRWHISPWSWGAAVWLRTPSHWGSGRSRWKTAISLQTAGWQRPALWFCLSFCTTGSLVWQRRNEPDRTSSPWWCQTERPAGQTTLFFRSSLTHSEPQMYIFLCNRSRLITIVYSEMSF